MSDSLWTHGLQHTQLPSLSLSPGVCSNSCLLSQCCHPIISSSVTHFSCPQSFPHQGLFQRGKALPIRWPMYFYALRAGNRCEWINLTPSIPLLTSFQSQLSCLLFLQLRSSPPPWGKGREVCARATPAWNLLAQTLEWQLLSPVTASVSLS